MRFLNRQTRHRSKRIAVFNNKGGVGKTTLTVNLSLALCAMGKRVLLVDADPQCNLTALFIATDVVDKLLDQSDTANGTTLWSALKPIVDGTGDAKAIPSLDLPEIDNGRLLPGDVRLAEFEAEMAVWWSECFQRKIRALKATTALSAVVNTAATEQDCDYVFYDCGPNIGALNRAVLLDCDGFIIPAACDLFSVRAIGTVGHTVERWIIDWRTIRELAPQNDLMMPGTPMLLGYVAQKLRMYGKQPSAPQRDYLVEIEKAVADDVASRLRQLDRKLVTSKSLSLPTIRDFAQLATNSQTSGLAMWQADGASAQQKNAEHDFSTLAKELIGRWS